MAPSGGLMMAENSSTSYIPRFEMQNVAPLISGDPQLAGARALGQIPRLHRDLAERLGVAVAQHRRDQPLSSATAMPRCARW